MRAVLDSLGADYYRRALVQAALCGAIGGLVGVHVLLRRLSFFVVAMSHATFPGVVLASMAGISLVVGGVGFGLVVVAAIVALGAVRRLDDASVVGIVLAGAFALGLVLQSSRTGGSRQLGSFLVGSVLTVSWADIALTAAVGSVIAVVLAALHKELVFGAFDRGAMVAQGWPVAVLDAVVLVVVMVAMVIAIPAVGTLLAVSLLTVPALTARLWSDRIGAMVVLSTAFGVASGVVGLLAAAAWDVAAGGAIALTAAAWFAVSLVVRRRPEPIPEHDHVH